MLLKTDLANASLDPFGNIVIFSDIFEAAESDDEIAIVLSHEIAHFIAKHEAPFLLSYLVDEISIFVLPPVIIATIAFTALFRRGESEADYISMLLASEAGFDPNAAVLLWTKFDLLEKRIHATTGKKQPAEYMSTHPHVSFDHSIGGGCYLKFCI